MKQNETCLCHLGHPSNLQSVRTESLDGRQRGGIKFEAVKVSEVREHEPTYLEYTHAAQPARYHSKCTISVGSLDPGVDAED